MKNSIPLTFLIISFPSLANTALEVKLNGGDQNIKVTHKFIEKKIDTKDFVFEGACFQGVDVISYGGATITKQKYSIRKKKMPVPTCNINTDQMKSRIVHFETVCGTPLLSSVTVAGVRLSGYFYPEVCDRIVEVKFCERNIQVNREIELNIKNFTNRSDQTLVYDDKGIKSLIPKNTYYAIKQRELIRKDLDLFNSTEIEKYKIAIVDPKEIADFNLSEINKDGSQFSVSFDPELQNFKDYFVMSFKITKKKKFAKQYLGVGETVLPINSDSNQLTVNFTPNKKKGRYKITAELGLDDRFEIFSNNPDVQYRNIRTLKFNPKK